jgi:3-(3-hydroxy-phenyl)propionate hydroxylase
MQLGNVFLAGDSAHQMPPFLGQGLNSGMRDAMNLAWKLAFVSKGIASEKLLDTYSTERVPHVRNTVGHAADLGRLINQLSGKEESGVDTTAGYGGARPQPFLETGLLTGDDPRVGHQFWFDADVSRAVVADGASFVVVATTHIELPAPLISLGARLVVSPKTTQNAYAIVVRPDRYVAAVAANADELAQCATILSSYV